jgi:hypothetical protein
MPMETILGAVTASLLGLLDLIGLREEICGDRDLVNFGGLRQVFLATQLFPIICSQIIEFYPLVPLVDRSS